MHLHSYMTVHKKVVAEFQKGKRETLLVVGDYQHCDCGDGVFVPYRKDYQTVPCELVRSITEQ